MVEEDDRHRNRVMMLHIQLQAMIALVFVTIAIVTASIHADSMHYPRPGYRLGATTIKRRRSTFDEIVDEVGPDTFRRMFRMHGAAFMDLYHILEPHMKEPLKRKRGATPNGDISNVTRLLMALRFFAGGCKYDIAVVFGVHHNEVYKSVWRVVDAVHEAPALKISFPATHAEQEVVAAKFKEHSSAGFPNCVGCIDGILVWTSKPFETAKELGCGPGKFYCGRKKKFGVQIQAVCDQKRRFLDVDCFHPGSASDFSMWRDCSLRKMVETDGFLAPGYVLFGDNAYVNTAYMVSPFKSVSAGPKDDFNFYHSQVRITIECAFGMLVHRWGCLRKPMPANFRVAKINSLVLALCMLQNFCIDSKEDNEVRTSYFEDEYNISMSGGLRNDRPDSVRLDELLDGGVLTPRELQHHRRVNASTDMEYASSVIDINSLPIFSMLDYIESETYRRPGPRGSTTTNS